MTNTSSKPNNPNEAKITLGLGKPPMEVKSASETKVTLKDICLELKLDPRLAREKLRIACRDAKKFPELAKARKPRTAWEWTKGSALEKEARVALIT